MLFSCIFNGKIHSIRTSFWEVLYIHNLLSTIKTHLLFTAVIHLLFLQLQHSGKAFAVLFYHPYQSHDGLDQQFLCVVVYQFFVHVWRNKTGSPQACSFWMMSHVSFSKRVKKGCNNWAYSEKSVRKGIDSSPEAGN